MNTQNPKLHFQRFEFKYILNKRQYYEIANRLRRFFDRDTFGRDDGAYEVVSLYFDSPRFYYYAEKIDGAKRRKKLRLRTYRHSGEYAEDVFFEIKRKHDAVVLKDRAVFNTEDRMRFEDSKKLSLSPNGDSRRAALLDELSLESARHALQPTVWVSYTREPYFGKYDPNTRITFDYDIRACRSNTLYPEETGRFFDVSGERVIMEVKFRRILPEYVAQIIKEYDLGRVPYSKYCEGLEACYTLPLLPMLGSHPQSETLTLSRDRLLI